MGEHIAIEARIAQASKRWSSTQFKRRTDNWADGPCPWCGGDDRFVIRSSGWYDCRKCARDGWIDENDATPPDPIKVLEARVAELERRDREKERRLSKLERMARSRDYWNYYKQMDQDGMRDLWLEQGFTNETIDRWLLGVCYHCKTDRPTERMSMTIPVFFQDKIVNIRHRLIGGDPSDKYRPHMAGLGNTLFNADDVYSDDASSIIVAEGEKKTIALKQYGLGNVVGAMGKAGFQKSWASRFSRFGEVLICLDPDAMDRAFEMSKWFGGRARVVGLPVKSDDFFVRYHGTVPQFREFLRMARRVH
jgi:hypothetical protein